MMPSWSSDNSISASDTSMPWLSTPRMVPTPSVIFLPGMYVPGGENTPFMPVRAFGAPHTTCDRIARAGIDDADAQPVRVRMLLRLDHPRDGEGASAFALSSMFSTSSPTMVSLSASVSSGSSVVRCSFSQESVNFMAWLRSIGARRRHWARSVPSPLEGEG